VPLPPTVAAHTPPPPSESSQTTRFLVGMAYCTVYYHYHYCSPTRTSLNASTARRHVPPSRVVTLQLRAALATQRAAQSFKFKMSVAKHQACFTTKLQGQNLATFSHSAVTPIAYLQHTPTKHALIMRYLCVNKINAVNNAIKKINCSIALQITVGSVLNLGACQLLPQNCYYYHKLF